MSTIYLYIKEHSITGMKYFGKTTRKNPFEYLGSGKKWWPHIKKHGRKYVKTLEVYGFDKIEDCSNFAIKFSIDNNIVESKNWANLMIEDAKTGGWNGPYDEKRMANLFAANEIRYKNKKVRIQEKVPRKPYSEETKKKMSESRKGRKFSESHKKNLGASISRKWENAEYRAIQILLRTGRKQKLKTFITCPHCQKTGRPTNMSRWHFENCCQKSMATE